MPAAARLACFIAVLLAAVGAAAQGAKKTVWDGVYLDVQADSGRESFRESCASCHRTDPTVPAAGRTAPALAGPAFLRRWVDQTAADLLVKITQTMPANDPDTLSSEAARDIVSFILRENGMPAGAEALPVDEGLAEIVFAEKPKD